MTPEQIGNVLLRLEQRAVEAAESRGRIEATLNGVVDRLDEHVGLDNEFHGDIEQRLRSMEGWRAKVLGMAAAVAAGISYLIPHK